MEVTSITADKNFINLRHMLWAGQTGGLIAAAIVVKAVIDVVRERDFLSHRRLGQSRSR
jgi:hypothetical protein